MPTTPNIQVRNSLMDLLALQPQVHPISWLTFCNTSTSEDETAQERWCCCIVSGRHRKDQFKQKAATPCFDNNTSKPKSYCTVGQAVPAMEAVFSCPRDTGLQHPRVSSAAPTY